GSLVYSPTKDNPRYYPGKDGCLVVISGNHRIEGAINSGVIEEVYLMEIEGFVDDDKLLALQLSHNSINGQDDPSLLLNLYEELPLAAKEYSGVTDDMFNIDPVDIQGLSIGAPSYEQVSLYFLPEDLGRFTLLLEEIRSKAEKMNILSARMEDFSKVFETLVRIKEELKVYNTASAFLAMAEMAAERLTEMELEAAALEVESQGEGNDGASQSDDKSSTDSED
ncbi:MAG: hypothetical protein AAFY17_14675, partial [Cyanobacteria bacterium J06642_11]